MTTDRDAIRDLPGSPVHIQTIGEGFCNGVVDHVIADADGDPLAIIVAPAAGADPSVLQVIVPWHAIAGITTTAP